MDVAGDIERETHEGGTNRIGLDDDHEAGLDKLTGAEHLSPDLDDARGTLICPECRTANIVTINTVQKLFVGAECIVCNTNRVEILLPACSHASLCCECARKMLQEPA
jgi:hypothetical protein